MSAFESHMYEQVLTILRRIIRAVDLHSHNLIQQQGITTPVKHPVMPETMAFIS